MTLNIILEPTVKTAMVMSAILAFLLLTFDRFLLTIRSVEKETLLFLYFNKGLSCSLIGFCNVKTNNLRHLKTAFH